MKSPLLSIRELRAAYRKRKDEKLWRWAKNKVISMNGLCNVHIAVSEGEFDLFLRDGAQVDLEALGWGDQVCSAYPLTDKHILIRKEA